MMMDACIVPGFEHRPGVHCGSTALRDLATWAGHDLSEPLCFGLGSGLGFFYLTGLVPSRVFVGRSAPLERDFCRAIGARYEERLEPDPDRSWDAVRERVAHGLPVVLQVDLLLLPYWKAKTPFNGHRIVLVGYDPSRSEALVADTHFVGLQSVLLHDLKAARHSCAPPVGPSDGLWLEIELPPSLPEMGPLLRRVVAEQGRAMLVPDPTGLRGIDAMDAFVEDLAGWGSAPDAAACALAAYHAIEKRGTGGALFRGLYRDFLAEASPRLGPAGGDLAHRMSAIASGWTDLALRFKKLATEGSRDFRDEHGRARDLAAQERAFAEIAAAVT